MDFRTDRVTELARQVREGERSATDLVRHSLAKIDELNPVVNAFVSVDADQALRQAAAIDQIIAAGGDPGPLAGIPIGVKDLEDAAGLPTTFGSALFADARPALMDSSLVARLRQAGCIVVGKTNTPEHGWTSRTENSLHGTTRNPWNLAHTPGGSSGGSAAAIAAGIVPLATGSDGGGSIRIPSACCGLSGMKTSTGRVPVGGERGSGWLHLSSKGPMARSIHDVAAALEAVIGPDPTDLLSLPRPEASFLDAVAQPHLPTVIGWSPGLGYAEIDAEVLECCEAAVSRIIESGIEVIPIDGPFDEDPVDPWAVIVTTALARSLGPNRDHDRYEEADPFLRMMVEAGLTTSGTEVLAAIEASHTLNLKLVEQFHAVRLILTPTTAAAAPPLALGGRGSINGNLDANWVKLTYPFNMTSSPAATVAVGLSSAGVPIGLQIVGPQHADLAVLRAAAAIEDLLGFDAVAAMTL